MIEGLEPIYQRIANGILQGIPEEWTVAKFEAIFFDDAITFVGEYTRSFDGKARSLQEWPNDVNRAFRELRRKFKDSGKPLWGQAIFELQPDGQFNLKWGYENCDDNGDTIWNEERDRKFHEDRRIRFNS